MPTVFDASKQCAKKWEGGSMRKFSFVLFLVLSSSLAFAEQQIPVGISGGGAADLLNMTTTPPALQDSHRDDDGVRHFCTDRYGRIVREDDQNYADCLRNKKATDPSQVAQPSAASQTIAPAQAPAAAQPTAAERSAAKAAGGAP